MIYIATISAENYMEPICCFNSSAYTGVPDSSAVPHSLDVPQLLKKYDILNHSGEDARAEEYLKDLIAESLALGDWRAEISFQSEMIGLCRKTGLRDTALAAIDRSLELIRRHGLGRTVSGATVILNAATTLHAFGLAKESIPLFTHVSRVFADNLDPADYRFAGLYNNMALSYMELGKLEDAERFYRLAIRILSSSSGNENDIAVTWCNLASLYDRISHEDTRIDECMEEAWKLLSSPDLPQDGYLVFTISKCISCFDTFGYFIYAKELRTISARIKENSNAGN